MDRNLKATDEKMPLACTLSLSMIALGVLFREELSFEHGLVVGEFTRLSSGLHT